MSLVFPYQKGFCVGFSQGWSPSPQEGLFPPIQPRIPRKPPALPIDSAIEPSFLSAPVTLLSTVCTCALSHAVTDVEDVIRSKRVCFTERPGIRIGRAVPDNVVHRAPSYCFISMASPNQYGDELVGALRLVNLQFDLLLVGGRRDLAVGVELVVLLPLIDLPQPEWVRLGRSWVCTQRGLQCPESLRCRRRPLLSNPRLRLC